MTRCLAGVYYYQNVHYSGFCKLKYSKRLCLLYYIKVNTIWVNWYQSPLISKVWGTSIYLYLSKEGSLLIKCLSNWFSISHFLYRWSPWSIQHDHAKNYEFQKGPGGRCNFSACWYQYSSLVEKAKNSKASKHDLLWLEDSSTSVIIDDSHVFCGIHSSMAIRLSLDKWRHILWEQDSFEIVLWTNYLSTTLPGCLIRPRETQ